MLATHAPPRHHQPPRPVLPRPSLAMLMRDMLLFRLAWMLSGLLWLLMRVVFMLGALSATGLILAQHPWHALWIFGLGCLLSSGLWWLAMACATLGRR